MSKKNNGGKRRRQMRNDREKKRRRKNSAIVKAIRQNKTKFLLDKVKIRPRVILNMTINEGRPSIVLDFVQIKIYCT